MKRKTGLARLAEIAGTKKGWLLASMVLSVLATAAQFVPFAAVYLIVAEFARAAPAFGSVDRSAVWNLAFLCLGAIGAYGLLAYVSTMLSHIAAFNILYELRMALIEKLSRLSLGYFTSRASGEIKKVLSEDVERIELFVAHHIPDLTSAVVFPLLVLACLFTVDWRLALVVLVVYIAAILVQSAMMLNSEAKKRMAEYQKTLGRMSGSVVEYVRGMPVVKIFNRSAEAFDRLKNDILAYRDFALAVTKDFSRVYTGFLTILTSTLLFLVPVSAFLLLRAPSYAAYLPKVLVFLLLGAGTFFPLLKLMWIGSLLTQNTVGVATIDEILDRPELPEPTVPRRPKDASLEFRRVRFGYGETEILKDVSFTAMPGTVTALVGPSGAGKTTIGLLAARFWDVNGGRILLGGEDLRDIGSERILGDLSFVFQDGFLFFDTIEENIRMGNRKASFREVEAAAEAAHCREFIERLPKGYSTLVGEGGTYLSGGEQQRLGLARAILKNSPVVVLDEATAFTDPENEGKILDSFSVLIRDKTVLVIAHRLSTIVNADQILVVEDGEITERGTHEELLRSGGSFKRMWDVYNRSKGWVLSSGKGDRS